MTFAEVAQSPHKTTSIKTNPIAWMVEMHEKFHIPIQDIHNELVTVHRLSSETVTATSMLKGAFEAQSL